MRYFQDKRGIHLKRIAFVINYIENNGPSNVVLDIINNMSTNDFEIYIITLFKGNNRSILNSVREKGIRVIECNTLSRGKCLMGFSSEFTRIIKENHIDIIHTHGIIPDVIASKSSIKAKKISTIHNNMFEDYKNNYGLLSKLLTMIHLRALNKLDLCACCSKAVYNQMRMHISRLCFVRNGITKKRSYTSVSRISIGIPDNAIVYLYAGGLTKGKRVDWLIEQFVSIHDSNDYLIVLGDGPLKDICNSIKDDNVLMLGFQSDVIAYMNIADYYISASQTEGFSISVLEAISTGTKLLLYDIPAHREVINCQSDMTIGLVFNNNNFSSKYIESKRLSCDRSRVINLFVNNFSAEKMAKEYFVLYIDLLNEQYMK